jgi:hypothetical protein
MVCSALHSSRPDMLLLLLLASSHVPTLDHHACPHTSPCQACRRQGVTAADTLKISLQLLTLLLDKQIQLTMHGVI